MAAAIAASVLVSVGVGVKDAGGGDSHCHDIQQILIVEEQKGFSGVRKSLICVRDSDKILGFLLRLLGEKKQRIPK